MTKRWSLKAIEKFLLEPYYFAGDVENNGSAIIKQLLDDLKQARKERDAYRSLARFPCNCGSEVDAEAKRILEDQK